jgi:hypothetical protein
MLFNMLNINTTRLQKYTTSSRTVHAIFSVLPFAILFYFIRIIVDRTFNSKYLANNKYVRPDKIWDLKNLQISFIHSTLSSLLLTYTFTKQSQMFDDMLLYVCDESYMTISFSLGYFLYDFLDMYFNKKIVSLWQITLHHIVTLSTIGYNYINLYALGYSLLALSMEYNSVFLHARVILKSYGLNNTGLGGAVRLLNMSTFIVVRFGLLIYGYYCFYYYSYRLSFIYSMMVLGTYVVMTVINIGLFQKLLMSDILGAKKDINNNHTSKKN